MLKSTKSYTVLSHRPTDYPQVNPGPDPKQKRWLNDYDTTGCDDEGESGRLSATVTEVINKDEIKKNLLFLIVAWGWQSSWEVKGPYLRNL